MDFFDVLPGKEVFVKRLKRLVRVTGKRAESNDSGKITKYIIETKEGEFTPKEIKYGPKFGCVD